MQISVSAQATLNNSSNYFVFALYDSTAPTVLLESFQVPKPYVVSFQYSFLYNCLNGHIYNIKLWESADTTPSGVVRNSFSQTVNLGADSVLIKMPAYLEVGVTVGLVAGASSYVNTDWAGWPYSLERLGYGTMTPLVAGETQNYSQDIAGGFTLTQMGDVFAFGEKFVARFIPKVISVSPSGTPSPVFSSGRVLTADTTLTNADLNQALLIQSATNKITITLPDLSTVQDYSFMYFFSNGGSHVNAIFQATGTDKILYQNPVSNIILGQCEILKIFKAFGVWNVDNDLPGVRGIGEFVYNYGVNPINTLPLSGQIVSRATYPRLWNWVANNLQTLSVVNDASWLSAFTIVDGVTYYTNQGFFSIGDGSTTFRLPKIDQYFLRPQSYLSRTPGGFELQSIQSHQHSINRGDAYSGSKYKADLFVGGGQGVNPQPGMVTELYGDTETRPSDIGCPLLIRI